MPGKWTLPLVKDCLDGLHPGGAFKFEQADIDHLFGLDRASPARVARFARRHGCEAAACPDGLILRKAWARPDASDEASAESFPASDPPAWTLGAGVDALDSPKVSRVARKPGSS